METKKKKKKVNLNLHIWQVVLNINEDKDITGHSMPNLIYVSREKSNASPNHFKAGAQNVLVSCLLTNIRIFMHHSNVVFHFY